MRPYPGHGMGSMIAGIFGFLGTLTLLGLLALLILFLIKRAKGRGGPGGPKGFAGHHHRPPMPPALQILDERLANGEIEIDDYVARRAAMLGTQPNENEWTPPPTPQPPTPPEGEDPHI
ncbi:MAG TPA: hypothetical protein PKV13_05595 [Propionicimonas sp.]|nr:hypothetical protein [Propionicimonas sp.]HRA06076.1 hypothetical protein [Propionicimonas sp.]